MSSEPTPYVPTRLVEGTGSVQLPHSVQPHPQVVNLINNIAQQRTVPTAPPSGSAPAAPASGQR